jgi:probable rRNA maturation factor
VSSQTQVQTQLQVELFVENSYQLNLTNQVSEERWYMWFSQWLTLLAVKLPRALSYEIGLQLTNDAQIQELNAQYRQKDQPTDVLAFAALENNFPCTEEMLTSQPLYLGDIVISIDTAIRQAQEREHNLTTELAWLSAHGLLHLLGWDHPDEQSLIEMLNKQSMLLKSVGIVGSI